VGLLLVDAVVIVAVVVGAALEADGLVAFAARHTGLGEAPARVIVLAGTVALCAPFCLGVVRVARRLGTTLAAVALPAPQANRADNADAPRRALVVTVQLAAVLLVTVPVLAITQPFVAGWTAAAVLVLPIVILGVAFWRTAADLESHVRAGAQVIVEALALQARKKDAKARMPTLEPVQAIFPGLGAPTPVRLDAASPAVGRTLADLDLRGVTGATVLAVLRGDEGVVDPAAAERLREGDVLALAGTHEAVAAATAVLVGSRG
jgi:CPA2 family monovalent cation:H+ antiporter-2